MGKLVVFEGIDGSGKSTQFRLLCSRLEREGVSFRRVAFPRYGEPSSALLRMYLAGEFGERPGDVNAYAASTFYAVDRFASYASDWGNYYRDGGVILTDRYTTSNAVHQASKLPEGERGRFFDWLYDFEFEKLAIPRPDAVLYFDVPVPVCLRQMAERTAKTGVGADIHERDGAYLGQCRVAAREAAARYGWRVIDCAPGGEMRSIDDIHGEAFALAEAALNGR